MLWRPIHRLRRHAQSDLRRRRYIVCVGAIATAAGATQLWFGIVADVGRDLTSAFPDLIPADGMTDDELAVVRRWIHI